MSRPVVRRAVVALTALLVLAGVVVVPRLAEHAPRVELRDARVPSVWLDSDGAVAVRAARSAPERPSLLGGGSTGWVALAAPATALVVLASLTPSDRTTSRLRRWRARLLGAPPAHA